MGGQRVDTEGRYEARAFCRNCEYLGPVQPPVGQWVTNFPCPVCGVKGLSPPSSESAERGARLSTQTFG